MASTSKRRSKAIDPITVDELMNAAGMSGFVSFLNIKPEDYRAAPPAIPPVTVMPPPDPAELTIGAPTVGAPTVGLVDTGLISTTGAPTVGAPKDEAGLSFGPEPETQRRLPRPVPAPLVQDGHTRLEDAVYHVIWRLGRQTQGTGSREIEIGDRTIAAATNTSASNVSRCLQALAQKLAMEIDPPKAPGCPKRIRIYDYKEILKRRREAGLTYVIRNRGAVTLVNPDTILGAPTVGAPIHAMSAPTVGAPIETRGAPNSTTIGAPLVGASIRNRKNSLETTTTTTAVLQQTLLETMGRCDDDALARIRSGCRELQNPTDSELAFLVRTEGPRLRANRKLDNPMGVLITHLPKCGPLLQQHREAQALHQAIIDDPDASDEEKRFARAFLEGEGKHETDPLAGLT